VEPPGAKPPDLPEKGFLDLRRRLERYFRGERVSFRDVPVRLPDAPMHRAVLSEVRRLNYGEVKTYGELAERVGTHPRVVGRALARNETPVLVPCHRVVGARELGGFRWGLRWKRRLLRLEGALKRAASGTGRSYSSGDG
ncbi:MAG: methylated-DNA--[protein]-cysteine S-methyltransferase, partial [Euryarchaeota archaeon]